MPFETLKTIMVTLSILAYPDFNFLFEVKTDASDFAYLSHTLSLRDQAKLCMKGS